MQHTISHIYNDYVETDSSVSKQTFVDICSEFNMMIIDYILDGKGKCKVKNKTVYRFDATRGVKGNKGKLKELDELDYLKFKKN